jgi:iron complex outermembrane receptor protein
MAEDPPPGIHPYEPARAGMGDDMTIDRKKLRAGAAALALMLAATPALAQQREFDVPAQEASSAISLFARQAGLQVVAPADRLKGVRTPALKGSLDARAALAQLIEGTGLEVASDTGGVVVLRFRAVASPAEASALDQVMVTAQKRTELAQEVPISLSAFNQRTMDVFRLDDIRDISRLTPGLLVSAFNFSSPTIAIRGASNTFTQIGANKPVAVVLDDLFIPRNSAAVFDLYGLNSVQVLRGPQGTLFGRNVTGGAILLDSGKPALGEASGSIRVGAGNYDFKQFDGLVDAPIGDKAALRLAGSIRTRDGYGRDRLTGAEADDQDSRSLRAQLRLQADPRTEVLLGADYGEDHNGGRTLSSKTAGSDGNRRTSELGYPQSFARNQWGASARAYWSGPIGDITSITGYRWSQSGEDYSGVGASYIFLSGTTTQAVNRDTDRIGLLSEELRYASPKWDWGDFVAGVYLADEDAKRRLRARTLQAATGRVTTDALTDQSVKTKSYGLFVDGNIHLPAHFGLTLGARYTHDKKTASLVRTDAINAAGSFAGRDLKADWGEITPRAVLNWTPSEDVNLYASVTKGYTAGGFNTDAATLVALTRPFDPETVTNWELGLKSQWLERRLRLNLSLFQMDYKDKQELYFDNLTRILSIYNAAKATAKGLEAELAYSPTAWLTLSANYGFLDTVYDAFVIPGGVVNTGHPLASSPRNKGSLAADLRVPVGGGYVFGSVSWAYTDGYYTGATKDPNLHIDSYALTNLSLGWEPSGGRWRLMAWAKNVGKVDYVLTPSTQGVLAEYLGEPRTYGLSVRARF